MIPALGWIKAVKENCQDRVPVEIRGSEPGSRTPRSRTTRAYLGFDLNHDEGDRLAGRRITCPTLLLSSCRTVRFRAIDRFMGRAEHAGRVRPDRAQMSYGYKTIERAREQCEDRVQPPDWPRVNGRGNDANIGSGM